MKIKNQVRLTVAITVCLAVLLVVSLSIVFEEPIYSTQSSLTTSYNTPFANAYWKGARFNNTQGIELANFAFALRFENQSLGPVLTTLSFGPDSFQSISLDSAKMTFTTGDGLSWPDIAFRVPTNGLIPQISKPNAETVVLSYQNLGFYGQGTETFDIWFGITIVTGAGTTNHSLFLTVDLTGHNPHSLVIGQSYSGEAVFKIVAQPNGLLYVADTAY